MTVLQQFKIIPVAMLAVTGLFSAGALAELPDGDYACQVQTEGGKKGLVLVQTDSEQQAIAAARGGKAIIADGTWREVVDVVECIDRRAERFRDADFQMQYKKTPM